MQNNIESLKNEIVKTVKDFNSSGLSITTTGNLSARYEDGFLITPTGVSYNELETEDIVYCETNGNTSDGSLQPSSEWRIHSAIYSSKKEINAVAHVHSPYATGLACAQKSIPAFHYMIALAGGDDIPCSAYATFGSDELSKNIVQSLQNRTACLMANHGQIAIGKDIASAYKLAHEVEALAKWYCISLNAGGPVLLDEEEMKTINKKIKDYGKQFIKK